MSTIDQLIPYLREILFCVGFATGMVVTFLTSLLWRS